MNLKKKVLAAILGGGMLMNFAPLSVASAEVKTIEAEGYYTMGDGPEENPAIAKERARADAKRAASEQACTFVESLSEIKDNQLTRDEIRTISATILQVVQDPISVEVINQDIIQYHCHIKVLVDTDNVQSQLYQGRDKLEEATQRIKELEEDKARLNAELAELKAKYKVASVAERKIISKEFKLNEEKFSALQLTEKGEECYNKRDYNGAIEALNKAIEIDPNYANAWAWLGAVYNDFGNSEKAMAMNLKAIEINPKNAMAWNNIGVTYSNLGNLDKAIESYERACSLDKKLYYPYSNLGRVYLDIGDFDKAIEYCNKAVEISPQRCYTWCAFGEVYFLSGNFRKAEENYNKAIELEPNNPAVWQSFGTFYKSQGKDEKAAEYFNKSIELGKAILQKSPEDTIEMLRLGLIYSELKDYDTAFEYCDKALEIYPNFVVAWNVKGNIYSAMGDSANAISCYKKVASIDQNNLTAWENLGWEYYKSGQNDKALETFQQAVKLFPKKTLTLIGLGEVYVQLNDVPNAVKCFKKATKLSPRFMLTWQRLGIVYQNKFKDYDKAIEYYTKATEIFPRNYLNWSYIGDCYVAQNKYEEAIRYYHKAIIHGFPNATPYHNIAKAYIPLQLAP